MIVPDASTLVEYMLRTPSGLKAEPLLTAPGADLHVPALCDIEVAAALRGLLIRERMTIRRCEQAVAAYLDMPLTRYGHAALLPRILELRDNMSAYDAAYVALAERLDAAFLTADTRLARSVSEHTTVALAG